MNQKIFLVIINIVDTDIYFLDKTAGPARDWYNCLEHNSAACFRNMHSSVTSSSLLLLSFCRQPEVCEKINFRSLVVYENDFIARLAISWFQFLHLISEFQIFCCVEYVLTIYYEFYRNIFLSSLLLIFFPWQKQKEDIKKKMGKFFLITRSSYFLKNMWY